MKEIHTNNRIAQTEAERMDRIASVLYLMFMGLNQADQYGAVYRERAIKAAPRVIEWMAEQAEEAATEIYEIVDDLDVKEIKAAKAS